MGEGRRGEKRKGREQIIMYSSIKSIKKEAGLGSQSDSYSP